jgi:hypothetical protein
LPGPRSRDPHRNAAAANRARKKNFGAARSVVELSTKVREAADLAVRLAELEQRLAEQDQAEASRNGRGRAR